MQDAIYSLVREYGLTLESAQALITQATMSPHFRISIKYNGALWIQYVRVKSERGVTPEQIGDVYRLLSAGGVWRSAQSLATELRVQPVHIEEALEILHQFNMIDQKYAEPGVTLWFAAVGARHATL